MKNTKNIGTGNRNAQAALADINAKIAALQQQRVGLAQPLKDRYADMAKELTDMAGQIRELDPSWKPASLRPKADDQIKSAIESNGKPMTIEEILSAVGNAFTKWRVKNVLKKKSSGPKAIFTLADGKYTLRAAA
jgi:hypothetical protein